MLFSRRRMSREMRRTLLRLMILKKIEAGGAYSYGLVKEFSSRHVLHILQKTDVKNDVYNAIGSLERSGYISARTIVKGGRAKKVYAITKSGSFVLAQTKRLFMSTAKQIMDILR